MAQAEIAMLHKHYQRLASMSKKDVNLGESHSIDEATQRHQRKHRKSNQA